MQRLAGLVGWADRPSSAVSAMSAVFGEATPPQAPSTVMGSGSSSNDSYNVIRYGDYVVLEVPEKGIVHSQLFGGRIPGRLVLHPVETFEKSIAIIDNIKSCVFKVQPRSKNEADVKLREAEKILNELQDKHDRTASSKIYQDPDQAAAITRHPARRVSADMRPDPAALEMPELHLHLPSTPTPAAEDNSELAAAKETVRQLEIRAASEKLDNANEKKRRNGQIICFEDVFQLRHSHTQRFLKIATDCASLVDPSDYGCDLVSQDNITHQCWFRFVAKTAQQSGGYVSYDDKLFIQSYSSQEYFMHLTTATFGSTHPEEGCQEIAFSSQAGSSRTLFNIHSFTSSQADNELGVRGGDCIQLYQKDFRNVLAAVAEPSTDPFGPPIITAPPYMRIRRGARSADEPTSAATTFWQIEHAEHPFSGRLVEPSSPIRLVHLVSRQYLAFNKGQFVLVMKDADLQGTVFQLSSVSQTEGRQLRTGNAVRLQCLDWNPRSSRPAHASPAVVAVMGVSTTVISPNPAPAAAAAAAATSAHIPHTASTLFVPTAIPPHSHASDDSDTDLFLRAGSRARINVHMRGRSTVRRQLSVQAPPMRSQKVVEFHWDHTEKAALEAVSPKSSEVSATELILFIPHKSQVRYLADVQGFRPLLTFLRATVLCIPSFLDFHLPPWLEDIFEEVCKWQTQKASADPGSRVRRKMMRTAMIVDELITLLQAIDARMVSAAAEGKQLPPGQPSGAVVLGEQCCRLLEEFSDSSSEKNAQYLAQSLNEIRRMADHNRRAFTLLRRILKSPRVVMSRFHDFQISKGVSDEVLAQIFSHFCHLCVCANKSYPTNQLAVLDAVRPYLWRFTVVRDRIQVTFKRNGIDCNELLTLQGPPLSGASKQKLSPVEEMTSAQWKLIGALCSGPNREAVECLRTLGVFDQEVFFVCINEPQYAIVLRDRCLRLLKNLFAVDPQEYNLALRDSLVDFNLCYNSIKLLTFRKPLLEPVPETSFREQIHKCVLHLTHPRVEERIVKETMDMLSVLSRRGFFNRPETTKELMTCLCHQLSSIIKAHDGSRDLPETMLLSIIRIVDALFNFNFNIRMQALMHDFVHLRQITMAEKPKYRKYCADVISEDALVPIGVRMELLHAPAMYESLKVLVQMTVESDESPEVAEAKLHYANARAYMKLLWDEYNWLFPDWDPSIPLVGGAKKLPDKLFLSLLVDLVEKKKCSDALLHAAFGLLDRVVCDHDHLLRLAIPAQLLCHQSTRSLGERLDLMLPDIRALSSSGLISATETHLADTVIRHLQELQVLCIYHDDEQEPCAQNQLVMRNYNIISYVLDLLFVAKFDPYSKLVFEALKLLRLMCQKSLDVQKDLFDGLDKLLFMASTYYRPGSVDSICRREFSSLLAAIFKFNYKCSMEVRALQIEKMVALVSHWELDAVSILTALRNLSTVDTEDRVIAGNQATILNQIYGNFKLFAEKFGVGTSTAAIETRAALLAVNADPVQEANNVPRREFHRELILTIATCCLDDDGKRVDSRVQRLFTLDTVLATLVANPANGVCDAYFVFFYSVFVKPFLGLAPGGGGSSGGLPRHLKAIIDKESLWIVMDRYAALCRTLTDRLRAQPNLLSRPDPVLAHELECMFVTYLPIVTALMTFLVPAGQDESSSSQRQLGLVTVLDLLSRLRDVFTPKSSPILFRLPPHYAQNLGEAVKKVDSYFGQAEKQAHRPMLSQLRELARDFNDAEMRLKDNAQFQSATAKDYQEEYYKEIEINSHYNTYCTALKIAYLGPFHIGHQLADSQLLPPLYQYTDPNVGVLVAKPLVVNDVSSPLDSCNKTNGLPRLGPGYINFLRIIEATHKQDTIVRRVFSFARRKENHSSVHSDRTSRVSEASDPDLSAMSSSSALLEMELQRHMTRYGVNYSAHARAVQLSRVLSAVLEKSERRQILQRELQTAVFFALRGIVHKAEIADTLSTAYRELRRRVLGMLRVTVPSVFGLPRPPPSQIVLGMNIRKRLIVAEGESSQTTLPHLILAVHAGSAAVALEALNTLELLLRQGANLRQFSDIVGGHNCGFFSDLADLMSHSLFLLQQAQKLQQSQQTQSGGDTPKEPPTAGDDKSVKRRMSKGARDGVSSVVSGVYAESSLGSAVEKKDKDKDEAVGGWGVAGGGEYKGFVKPEYDQLTASEAEKMTLFLRLIDALCDNDNIVLKQLMRHQSNAQRSVNILGLVARILHTATCSFEFVHVKTKHGGDDKRRKLLLDNIALATECLRALQSMCTGCDPNRREAVRSLLADTVMMNIFRHHHSIVEAIGSAGTSGDKQGLDIEQEYRFLTLEVYSLQILLVVMEDDDETTEQIAKEMITILTPQDFVRILLSRCFSAPRDRPNDGVYTPLRFSDDRSKTGRVKEKDLDHVRGSLVCSILVVFKRLSELARRDSNVLLDAIAQDKSLHRLPSTKRQSPRECLQLMIRDCETRCLFTVEIVRGGSLNRIYFVDVRREWQPRNLVQWLAYLQDKGARYLADKMHHSSEPLGDTQLSSDFKPILDQVAMCNLEQRPKMLVEKCCEILDERQYRLLKPKFFVSDFWRQTFDYVLVLVAFIINLVILVTWTAPDFFQDPQPNTKERGGVDYESLILVLGIIQIFVATFVLLGHIFTHTRLMYNLVSWQTAYCISLPVMAGLGILSHGYLFCYHLFHVIRISKDILHVVRSVTQNIKMIFSIFLLIVLVVYVYSLAAFAYLRKEYVPREGLYCDTTFQCLVTNLNFGIRGTLVDALFVKAISFDDIGTRVIFDISFFILVNVVALNVVLGVIVDTFSEIREEDNRLRETKRSECMICGISRKDIDKKSKTTFAQHVSEQHNRIHYLRFFQYLRDKAARHKEDPHRNPPLSSHELYVHRQITPDSQERIHNEFVPIKQALCVVDVDERGAGEHDMLRSLQAPGKTRRAPGPPS